MRYFGSKCSAVEQVFDIIHEKVPSGTICDPFGGIGTVGSYFKSKKYTVWSGDILTSAHYFQIARIGRTRTPSFKKLRGTVGFDSAQEIVCFLNNIPSKYGWFVREYAENRRFFTIENALRINACWLQILAWKKGGLLSYSECAVLLASLINSMDKVANTAGTYYSYLKKWYRKSILQFSFDLINCTQGDFSCRCFLTEASDLVSKRSFDVLYLDPPYNSRNYSCYYHLPETLVLGLKPKVHGVSGIHLKSMKASAYNNQSAAKQALLELLENAKWKLLVFHYADDGLISRKELRNIFKQYGKIEEFIIDSKGYTTEKSSRETRHRLYLVSA
jgi:adenine-specific DNA-methyltransferase